jgi:hypothetical protein
VNEEVPKHGTRKLEVGDSVRFKRGNPPRSGVATIDKIFAGYATLLWIEADGKRLNSSCAIDDLELVSKGSKPPPQK